MPSAEEVSGFVYDFFKARGGEIKKQEATAAVGWLKGTQHVFVAIQRSPFAETQSLQTAWKVKFGEDVTVIDAREYVSTKLNKGEWTSYHSEMIILSAMFNYNSQDLRKVELAGVKGQIKGWQGGVICANAKCCIHCASMLDEVGVLYHEKSSEKGDTGWWNPMTDRAYGHGTPEFNRNIPGF